MRLTGTTYQCDWCGREEREKKNILNWITLGILRDEVAPMRDGKARWRRDFCSRQCLAAWVTSDREIAP